MQHVPMVEGLKGGTGACSYLIVMMIDCCVSYHSQHSIILRME